MVDPRPFPMKQKLYRRSYLPPYGPDIAAPMIAHVLVIDTKAKGIEFLVTPPDSEGEKPLNARTTSQFLAEFHLQVAVNGGEFSPWWSHSPADYYPHIGDPVTPLGFAASEGRRIQRIETEALELHTLYINRRNVLSFNNRPSRIYNAISGDRMLVLKGETAPDFDDAELDPRTALGINRNGRYLYIAVVDGRQPFYSDGATFAELAKLLIDQAYFMGMSLDGGGSSTMVIEGGDGQLKS